jgi:hypothetical protein
MMTQEQIRELQDAEMFLRVFSKDSRVKDLIEELQYTLAMDRQQAKSGFKVVTA